MVRLTDHLDMTIAADWDVKPQTKQKSEVKISHQCLNILTYISKQSKLKQDHRI